MADTLGRMRGQSRPAQRRRSALDGFGWAVCGGELTSIARVTIER
jgi:hypothetical protein